MIRCALILVACLFSTYAHAAPNLFVHLTCTSHQTVFRFQRLPSIPSVVIGELSEPSSYFKVTIEVRPVPKAGSSLPNEVGWFTRGGRQLGSLRIDEKGQITGEVLQKPVVCTRLNTVN